MHEDGTEAFLKALNFQSAFVGPGNLVDRLAEFVSAYRFERDLLAECSSRRMSRVVRLLAHGEISVPEAGVLSQVPYLVLERADGDIRLFQAKLSSFDAAWVLRTLKHVTVGLEQLHTALTAHQDLKPSNVLTQDGGREMKLGDLGRAERRGVEGPWSSFPIPGAVAYAPPEQLYGAFTKSWEERRAGDLYLLGSLAVQLLAGNNITALLQLALPKSCRAANWAGDFSAVLPYLVSAHAEVMLKFERIANTFVAFANVPRELTRAVAELTAPDPVRRGHPRDRSEGANPYSVRRYVSLFNRLTAATEFQLRRA